MITCRAITTGGLGRFGNTCFSIASTIGIAARNGQSFGFDKWVIKDNELFGGTADDMSQYFVNPLPGLNGETNFRDIPYHWHYQDYKVPTGNWNICSHLQDPRYFEDFMPLVRHYFRMKYEPEQMDAVIVHFRAGDYIDDPTAYHPRCSPDYYNQAMSIFEPGTKFYILTDDVDAAVKLFSGVVYPHEVLGDFARKKILRLNYEQPDYLADFAFMKRCKSFITANSSFSYFAALLDEHPDKKIVMPKNWFGSSAGIKFEGYCKNAIVI